MARRLVDKDNHENGPSVEEHYISTKKIVQVERIGYIIDRVHAFINDSEKRRSKKIRNYMKRIWDSFKLENLNRQSREEAAGVESDCEEQ